VTTTDVAVAEGYSVPEAGPSVGRRLWRLRWWFLAFIAIGLAVFSAIARANPPSSEPLSTRNANPDGAMATAEILKDQGVRVGEIAYLGRAGIDDPSRTTLAIVLPSNLTPSQLDSILDYPGDVVFVGIDEPLIDALDVGLTYVGGYSPTVQSANCVDPDALAAGRTTAEGPWVTKDSTVAVIVCFANQTGAGTYAVILLDGRKITLLSDPTILMNGNLTKEGNAALVFRVLGEHRRLVWYLPAVDDTTLLSYLGGPAQPPTGPVAPNPDFLPPGVGDAIVALAIAGLVAAVWRARRMGPLVTETLPVVVHASESVRGRGRLYRRAHAYGRASAALRGAAAERMGRQLGISRGAAATHLIGAVAHVTGRDPAGIERLLYGKPPSSEAAMMDLVKELDTLEKEVHRP
jgi:hypothetical protein